MHAATSPKAYRSGGGQKTSPVLVLGLFVIVLACLFFGGWTYLVKEVPTTDPTLDGAAHVKGDLSAPVSVVVFGDFLCRDCGRLALDVLPELEAEFIETGVVKLAFRHYPMDGDESLRRAVASECAARQGKFWDLHDVLYGWRTPGEEAIVSFDLARQLAIGAGVSPRAFDACMSDPAIVAAVERDLLAGHHLGVSRAPAVFVNGGYAGPDVDYTRIRALVLRAATAPTAG